MTSKILSSRDLEFMLFEWLDARSLTERPRFQGHSESTFRGVLELSKELATEHFAGHNRLNDLSEPRVHEGRVIVNGEVSEALRRFAESGLIAATIDEANGGFQLPEVIHRACFMWFQAANIGTISYPRLTMANAHLLLTFGSDSVVERYVTPMLEGRYFGTMCPLRARRRFLAWRPDDRCGSAGRRRIPRARQQDVDLRRRTRPEREHHPFGGGPNR